MTKRRERARGIGAMDAEGLRAGEGADGATKAETHRDIQKWRDEEKRQTEAEREQRQGDTRSHTHTDAEVREADV